MLTIFHHAHIKGVYVAKQYDLRILSSALPIEMFDLRGRELK